GFKGSGRLCCSPPFWVSSGRAFLWGRLGAAPWRSGAPSEPQGLPLARYLAVCSPRHRGGSLSLSTFRLCCCARPEPCGGSDVLTCRRTGLLAMSHCSPQCSGRVPCSHLSQD